MMSLAGRAKRDSPACARVKNVQLNPVLPEGYCEGLFQPDEDTYSIQSCASSIASSIAPSIVPSEYVSGYLPTATITIPIRNNVNLSQESNLENGSVLSSSSPECSKDQPKQSKPSIIRKPVKKSKRRKPVDGNPGGGFRRSLSPRDVIKEDEVLDLSQESDIIPIGIPQTSPAHVSCLCLLFIVYLYMFTPPKIKKVIRKPFPSTSRMYEAVQVLYVNFVTFML